MADHTKAKALACRPFHNSIVEWQVMATGQVMLEYPLPMKPFFRTILQKFSKVPIQNPTKKLQLDELGSAVWTKIDGQRQVRDIISEFAQETNITLQESELSITAFLRELGKRGLIGMEETS